MANTTLALSILAGLALILALVIPLLNAIPKLSSFISLRWSCVSVILLIMVGVVIDFEPLADTTRDIALKGGLIIVAAFIILRTIEKVLANGWLKGMNIKGTVTKGDIVATVDIKKDEAKVEVKDSTEENKEEKEAVEGSDNKEENKG